MNKSQLIFLYIKFCYFINKSQQSFSKISYIQYINIVYKLFDLSFILHDHL